MIADLLHKIAGMEFASEEDRPYYPRPSIAGPQRCIRQMVYWACSEPKKPLPGRAVVVFSDSSWHEELTMDLLRKSNFAINSEQMPITIPGVFPWMPEGTWFCGVCEKEVLRKDCHGHLDWIITDVLGVDRAVEHKALSHFACEALMRGEMPYDNLTQKSIYMRGAQRYNPDLREGLLLIKNKNTSGYMEYRCCYDGSSDSLNVIESVNHRCERQTHNLIIPRITGDAFDKFREVDELREKKKLPARPYEIDSWRCQYCPYFETCWEGWAEEHTALATDVTLENEVADMVRYEREIAGHLSDLKKEREKLQEGIKNILTEKQVRSGRAGEYTVDWTVTMQKRFDKELLPPGMYEAASVNVPIERLNIRKIKEGKK